MAEILPGNDLEMKALEKHNLLTEQSKKLFTISIDCAVWKGKKINQVL